MDANFTLSGEPLALEYELSYNDIVSALKAVEHRNTFKKKLLQSAVAVVLIVGFAYSVIMDTSYTQGIWLGLLSALLLVLVWLLPHFAVVSTAKNMMKEANQVKMALYENGFSTGEGVFYSVMQYGDVKTVMETADAFIVEMKQQRVFIVPKSAKGYDDQRVRELLLPKSEDEEAKV